MSGLVVDASAAIACAAPDEQPPSGIREGIRTQQLLAPALWPFEIYNVLWMLLRRGRISEADFDMGRGFLDGLHVELEVAATERVRQDTLQLAMEYQLTVYDASYLELARRRRLPLATLDSELRKAAVKAKVKLR